MSASVEVQGYHFVSRFVKLPYVSSLLERGNEYYVWGRESSKVVAFAESSLEGGLKWVQNTVSPVLENPSFKNYAEPLLFKADHLGTTALDKVESSVQKIRTSVDSTKQVVEEKVNTVKTTSYSALETSYQKLVTPVDSYLKDSVLVKPYTLALDTADKYLTLESKEDAGPISRTTTLVVAVPTLTLAKLQSFRSNERPKSLDYTVELLKHAAVSLDNALYSLGESVGKGVHNGTTLAKEAPKEVKEKVQKATQEALTAVSAAIETLSAKLPAPLSERLKQITDLAEKGTELKLFTNVAQSSSKLLQDLSNSLYFYVQKGEAVPQQLLSTGLSNLQKIYESLHSLVETKKREENNGNEHSVDNIGGSN